MYELVHKYMCMHVCVGIHTYVRWYILGMGDIVFNEPRLLSNEIHDCHYSETSVIRHLYNPTFSLIRPCYEVQLPCLTVL